LTEKKKRTFCRSRGVHERSNADIREFTGTGVASMQLPIGDEQADGCPTSAPVLGKTAIIFNFVFFVFN
jgi:hypothetical protein